MAVEVGEVVTSPGGKIIQDTDIVPVGEAGVDKMGANEARTSCYQNPHRFSSRTPYSAGQPSGVGDDIGNSKEAPALQNKSG
jgi:hypothetical protein